MNVEWVCFLYIYIDYIDYTILRFKLVLIYSIELCNPNIFGNLQRTLDCDYDKLQLLLRCLEEEIWLRKLMIYISRFHLRHRYYTIVWTKTCRWRDNICKSEQWARVMNTNILVCFVTSYCLGFTDNNVTKYCLLYRYRCLIYFVCGLQWLLLFQALYREDTSGINRV